MYDDDDDDDDDATTCVGTIVSGIELRVLKLRPYNRSIFTFSSCVQTT